MHIKPSITTRLSILFISVIVTLISLTGGILYVNVYRIFTESVIKDLSQLSFQLKYNIDAIISGIDQATMQLYTNSPIIEALGNENLTAADTNESVSQINKQLYNLVLNNVLSSYYVSFFLDENISLSSNITSSDFFYNGVYNNHNISSDESYKSTIEKDGALYLASMADKRNVPFMCVSRLVKNCIPSKSINKTKSTNDSLGVIYICFNVSHIKNLLDDARLTPNSQIVLTSEDGTILYNTNKGETGMNISDYSLPNIAKSYSNLGTFIEEFNGNKYVINSLMLRADSHLLTIIPTKDIVEKVTVIKKIVLIACIISALVGILLTLLISNSITNPIRKLAKAMSRINDKESLDMYMQPPSTDEVGVLYESFNNMILRVTRLINDVHESGKKEKEAEIRALEAQINPHFLYNTLDSVNWLALGVGANDIADIISSLSEILRYSIKNENELITIKEEKIQLDNYINIQKICYGDNFDLTLSIDESLMENKIPKLVLQPLVENALQHGISKTKKRGYIEINGYIEKTNTIITVENNGGNIDINNLNNILENGKQVQNDGSHGIRNVNQRIKLHFGENYGLRYEKSVYKGVKAIITLPYKEETL